MMHYSFANSQAANPHAAKVLKASATLWFITAASGQWLFLVYLLMFYGPRLLSSGLSGLGGTGMPGGYIPGDLIGNAAVAMHLLLAVTVIGGGALQLVPQIREQFPAFHRWNGRIFLPSAVIAAITGGYLTLARNNDSDVLKDIGACLNAALIIIFSAVALRHAMARRISVHRRWAMRLYLAVNGVWFFRVGLMFWFYTTGGIGIDTASFTGPFLTIWTYGQFLVPLAVLELYLRALDNFSDAGKHMVALLLCIVTVIMGIGIWRAYEVLWLPRM